MIITVDHTIQHKTLDEAISPIVSLLKRLKPCMYRFHYFIASDKIYYVNYLMFRNYRSESIIKRPLSTIAM